ncbi:VWA domain-containing protein [Piscibacillus sp. B03]|uniref:VWA domain-containing protein n=1 Tax=Piscibacillus sp. B03 TaxID=3457430 RepID=UPI003FCE4E6D
MWKKSLLIILLFVTLIAGCSKQENETSNKSEDNIEQNSKVETDDNHNSGESNESEESKKVQKVAKEDQVTLDEIEPIPTDVEGLANQLPGIFAGVNSLFDLEQEIKEQMDVLGPMSEEPTDEEYEKYLRYIYYLVAEDYPDPENVIKKWEFASFGDPDLPGSKFSFKENYNVEIILDSSGSMANPTGNGSRMNVAKKSINEFLSEVPEEANVSLRVYGHKGTGADSDKEMSCNAIEQVYGFNTYNEGKFQEALNQFKPMGWTPLADALKESQEALSQFDSEKNTNLIYVVSDGIETCDGDPVAVAKELSESSAQPIINIIGFQTDAEAQKQLEKMAEVSGGIFASASNEEELQEEFNRAEEVLDAWKDWKNDAMRDLDAKRVNSSFDIMGLHNDWSFTTMKISNRMNNMVDISRNLEIFTHSQRKELKRRIKPIIDEIDTTVDQLEKDLEELRDKNLQEAKEIVEEKYKSQTSEE